MPEGKNKGYGFRDKYVTKMDAIAEGMIKAQNAAGSELKQALTKWVAAVEKDAKTILARPHWLLQQSITDKVVDYGKGKVWAMAGFRFQSKDPRDPGFYGKYHEAGWAPDRVTVKVPDHFLRRAKQQNDAALLRDVDAALGRITKIFTDTIKGA